MNFVLNPFTIHPNGFELSTNTNRGYPIVNCFINPHLLQEALLRSSLVIYPWTNPNSNVDVTIPEFSFEAFEMLDSEKQVC